MSHGVMEKIMVSLKNSLHDKSEMVRVSFLNLLIKMKEARAVKVHCITQSALFNFRLLKDGMQKDILSAFSCQFWDVCTMDHLLARLANDTQSICRRITKLLLKSFFPVNESDNDWYQRCITLIQMNPMAARKFYLHVYLYMDPTYISKLLLKPCRACAASGGSHCPLSISSSQVDVED